MTPSSVPPRHFLRQRLLSTLRTDADLDAFCLDFFPTLATRFSRGMDRQEKLSLLLESTDGQEIEQALGQYVSTAQSVSAARMVVGPRRRRSTLPSTVGEPPFTGRSAILSQIGESLAEHRAVIVYGGPGLGKSRLVKEYAQQHIEAYPGGVFFVRFGEQLPPIDLASLLREFEPTAAADERFEDACRRALGFVGAESRALLIYDGVRDEDVLRDWLPRAGLDWHLIATSNFSDWSSSWCTLVCESLAPADAALLVGRILKEQTATVTLTPTLVERAGGVTIELCASALAVAAQLRKGRRADVTAALAASTISSFAAPWTLLSSEQQRLLSLACLFASTRVPAEPLCQVMESVGWSAAQVEQNIDALRGSGLATGQGDVLEIHQLVVKFVRARGDALVSELRPAVLSGLVKVAKEFADAPGNLTLREKLQAYDLRWPIWADLAPGAAELHQIGRALLEAGRFQEAYPWSAEAVEAQEEGAIHGRVDHERLGSSLHQVGDCLSDQGRFAEAQQWFERAVQAKEKGDVHGRVDHTSLGRSLHQVGYCFPSRGHFAEAQQWFERSVQAKEKGDIHGRVDHQILGNSLHQVGYCLSSQDRFAEAQPWFERSVQAAEKGDHHGRVDHTSLGISLHQVGDYLLSQDRFAEAQPWFERAVQATEKGDIHGRVDHTSIGISLHQVGDCLSSQGHFAEALPWFKRAVQAKEKGDIHGRVDHEGLGCSLHQVGDCLALQDRFAEAQPWFERAVQAAEKGDIHGRIDHTNLGIGLERLGQCLAKQGREQEAQLCFERAARARTESAPGNNNP